MSDTSTAPSPQKPACCRETPAWRGPALALVALAATFGLGILAASILERRQEALRQQPLRPIEAMEMDAAKWGEIFPREYDSYKRMEESTSRTKYGGASQRDYLAETPANVVLFAGYAFAKDYRQARGHVHAVEDVSHTLRMQAPDKDGKLQLDPAKPATCWTCKSPDVPRMMAKMGVQEFYAAKFVELKGEITHPIGCYDCHDPKTMGLHITRPALLEALKRKDKNFDIAKVSHQEMRSLVCAQCHVEYYFRGKGNYLTFPWDQGTAPEDFERYYDEADFSDWTHAISKTRMIKIQHPDYEVYRTGVHAYRDVSCADCHMPYHTEGGVKFTDHHLQSPLLNLANSCAVCHRWSEQEIRQRVEGIQDKVREGRGRAEAALSLAHFDVAAAMQAGADDKELAETRKLIRHAQLRWDYVAANNGMGFHAPQECQRILSAAVDLAGQARLECNRVLARHGVLEPVRYPDVGTKEKAQAVIKLFGEGKGPALLPGAKRP